MSGPFLVKLISQLGGVGSTVHPTASPLPLQRLQLEEFNGGSPMSQRSGADVHSSSCTVEFKESFDYATKSNRQKHKLTDDPPVDYCS